MEVFGLTNTGKVRRENQDTFAIEHFEEQDAYLCAVLDGMGGARGGKIASSMGAEAFVSHVRTLLSGNKPCSTAVLLEAADYANQKIQARSIKDPDCAGMGTTLVSVYVRGNRALLLNIGDSRGYLLSDGLLRQLTRDHSYVEDLVRQGNITAAQARNHPKKNLITRALGIEDYAVCDTFTVETKNGDILILCSDGLTNELTDDEIRQTVLSGGDVREICEKLLEAVLTRRAADNITVIANKF